MRLRAKTSPAMNRFNQSLTNRKASSQRRGTTVVEAAFVLPVMFFLVLAIVEFGHAQMVANLMQSACRSGARLGSTEGTTTAQVNQRVTDTLGSAVDTSTLNIFVNDASGMDNPTAGAQTVEQIENMPSLEVRDAEPRQLFVVRATIPYNDIALVPMPFMDGVILGGQSFMRHE